MTGAQVCWAEGDSCFDYGTEGEAGGCTRGGGGGGSAQCTLAAAAVTCAGQDPGTDGSSCPAGCTYAPSLHVCGEDVPEVYDSCAGTYGWGDDNAGYPAQELACTWESETNIKCRTANGCKDDEYDCGDGNCEENVDHCGTVPLRPAQVPTSHELMARCPHEIRACIAAHGCMARLAEELERAARTGEGLCEDLAACSPELQAVAAACELSPAEQDDPPPPPAACDFMAFMQNMTFFEQALVEANDETLAMQFASENEERVQVCADVLRPDMAVSARCSDPHAPTGPSDCAFGELVDCWFHWDRALTPPLDKGRSACR